MTAEKLIEIARKDIGYTEYPPNSNMTKYGAEYGMNGYSWCVMYLWWCFREAGLSRLFYGGGRTASCTQLRNWYKDRGLYSTGEPKVGDIVIMTFEAGGGISHCGLCVGILGNGAILTIEGNTSRAGSQDNGGMVAEKVRYQRNIIGFCHPQYPKAEDDEMLTYEQFVDYMKRYEAERSEKEPAEWSKDAREWASANGIISGDDTGKLRWKDPITREEYAATEYRQKKSTAKKSTAK